MSKKFTNSQEDLKRIIEVDKIYRETTLRLKRHYKLSGPQIDSFWQAVWESLLADQSAIVDDVISTKMKLLGKGKHD